MASRRSLDLATAHGSLFEQKPIKLEGFILRARSAEPVGKPSLKQWQAAFTFASAAEEASPYWVGDLLAYAETREEWHARMDQAKAVTGMQHHTLENHASVSRHVQEPERMLAPTFSHARAVSGLPRVDQTKFLQRAVDHGWNASEMVRDMRAARRARIIEGQAVLAGQYRVIFSDNPWEYGNRQPSGSSQSDHYPPMSIEDMCKLPVKAHALPNSVLAMWVPAPLLLQNPGPREVGEAWGFTYKQNWVWDKVDGAGGNYSTGNHEHLTFWTRGSCTPDVPNGLPDSVQTIQKSRVHSEKPEEFRRLIERHWTIGPYLELFGREPKDGWDVFGNDARLWAEEKATA